MLTKQVALFVFRSDSQRRSDKQKIAEAWEVVLGQVFHRYCDAQRFAKLARDLVGKHGFIPSQAKVYVSMTTVAFWTLPITTAIDFTRATSRAAIETGDLTVACYGKFHSVAGLLLRNDPLDTVWRESGMALDFARKAKYGDAASLTARKQLGEISDISAKYWLEEVEIHSSRHQWP